MEQFNMVIQAISTVGFPIVVCLIMIYMVYKMNETHKAETTELRKVIENNTLSITKLYEKIDALIDVLGKGNK